ncbi:TRAP transporter substrate-binding protein [Halalkalibacter kiskunsagensis]|uniref:TRAP transporter substrate-binding protein n=1 Tax=Halalkalibacter kiskunsagensis TaxID=1548599 RepID=A0ABV6KGF6_9BACI
MKMKALLFSTLASALVLTGCGGGNDAATEEGGSQAGAKTIKIANYFAADHSQNVALEEVFKPMVEEQSEGRLKVEIYENNQLGDEAAFTDGVRNGTIEMVIAGMGLQANNAKIGVTEWPYLLEDYDHANEILNGPIGEEIAAEFEEFNVKPLGYTANGFRVVSADEELRTLEDFKGFRLRMPNVPIFLEVGEALGANVQALGMSEVFTALEQGVINGQENPYASLVNSSWYEVQSHVLETNHMFSPNIYLMNMNFWDSLDPELQEIVEQASEETAQYQWELAVQSDDEMKEYLTEQGLEIIVLSEEERQQFVDAMDPVYEKLFEKHDWAEELVNRIREQ